SRHTMSNRDWSSDVCSSDLAQGAEAGGRVDGRLHLFLVRDVRGDEVRGLAEFGRSLLTRLGVEVDHDDLGTGGQETFGGGSAESGGSAGDERDCVLQVHGCSSLHLSERSVEATLTQACGTGHLPVHPRSAWLNAPESTWSQIVAAGQQRKPDSPLNERASDSQTAAGPAGRPAGGPCSVCARFDGSCSVGDPVGDHF